MKSVLFLLLATVILEQTLLTQQGPNSNNCPIATEKNIDFYIVGSADSIQPNGLKVRVIDTRLLVKGFKLASDDSLVKIISCKISFDSPSGNIYEKPLSGNEVSYDTKNIDLLQKIRYAKMITIDNIKVSYKGLCYSLKGQVYHAR
ncbi:MAG TPA: hypothetical protein PKC72_01260 [Chitinophagaceae bacterium]|nr:hypothetical protein [Chitinophagaceae bacterium]